MRSLRSVALGVVIALAFFAIAVGPVVGCGGCAQPLSSTKDAGNGIGEGEGEGAVAGEGEGAVGEGEGEGFVDAGLFQGDAGNGFDLGQFLDGGAGACLPDQLPTLSVAGGLQALGLGLYQGHKEDGVLCGVESQRVNCGPNTPCCVLCGLGACGVDVTDAGQPPVCPPFTNVYNCDGNEDCSGNNICCFTLGGSDCRPSDQCNFDVNAAITSLLEAADGGFHLRDAGFVDGGFEDGGFANDFVDGGCKADAGLDGGSLCVDGGDVVTPERGPPGPQPDAGSLLDGLQNALNQGVPVCTSSFTDCDILHGEACCTSDRLVAVDIGFCMPALLCLGAVAP
jgi:hypothetical protein